MSTPQEIETYYDKLTDVYRKIYGDVIQAFRPSSDRKLLAHLAKSAGLRKGQVVLDAGCGTAGPAIWFARHKHVRIEGITISGEQARIAQAELQRRKLTDRIHITQGDFHRLTDYYPENSFDNVLFLESLGHAHDAEKVLTQASRLTICGGTIFIKDFFRKESGDPGFQLRVDTVIERMNRHYCYNALRLTPVIDTLRRCDFEIEFIRRIDFDDDTSVRAAFEEDQGIDIFQDMEEFWPAEWLEIKMTKH